MTRKESKVLQDKIKSLMSEPKMLLNFYKDFYSEKVLELSFHIYGNFVIQKFLETQNMFIYDDILKKILPKIVELANNKYACRIIQLVSFNLVNQLMKVDARSWSDIQWT